MPENHIKSEPNILATLVLHHAPT